MLYGTFWLAGLLVECLSGNYPNKLSSQTPVDTNLIAGCHAPLCDFNCGQLQVHVVGIRLYMKSCGRYELLL